MDGKSEAIQSSVVWHDFRAVLCSQLTDCNAPLLLSLAYEIRVLLNGSPFRSF